MPRKIDRVAYYEKQMKEFLKDAEKEGIGKERVKAAVRQQFYDELRDATMEAYEDKMLEMGLAPQSDVEAMIWSTNLGKSFVIDDGSKWVKPGGVLIMYEEGGVPSPGEYPESPLPIELQAAASEHLEENFSPRVYIEDINVAVGMVAVESDVFGAKQVMGVSG